MKPAWTLIAAAHLLAAVVLGPPALAQTAATGLVADPCVGAPKIPAEVIGYMQARYRPGPTPPLPVQAAPYLAAKAEAAKRDWPDLCHYRADNLRLAAAPQSGRQVVFMGDSITEAWALAHPDFFGDGLIDRGISGQTTPQMLVRFQADVVALKPRAVHIMAATNDLAGNTGPTSEEDIRNNIRAMVTLAKANRIAVILASTPPAAVFAWSPGLKPAPQVRALNAWLQAYAREQGATYVDYYAALATPEGAMRPEMTLDGVHPNAAGYAAMEPLTRAAIARAIGR
jgi:lysophospholipase L1-like esterase